MQNFPSQSETLPRLVASLPREVISRGAHSLRSLAYDDDDECIWNGMLNAWYYRLAPCHLEEIIF